eukprot:214772-Rhodomonas_salina.2
MAAQEIAWEYESAPQNEMKEKWRSRHTAYVFAFFLSLFLAFAFDFAAYLVEPWVREVRIDVAVQALRDDPSHPAKENEGGKGGKQEHRPKKEGKERETKTGVCEEKQKRKKEKDRKRASQENTHLPAVLPEDAE